MALGQTLASLIEGVQLELEQSNDPNRGQAFRPSLTRRIQREYRRLYHDFAWPHLCDWYDITTTAGLRHYGFPTEVLNLEQIIDLHQKWSGNWIPLTRGITLDDYNAHDSDEDERCDPALKWRPHGAHEIEIWPLPASATTIRFWAKKAFTPLVAETDLCDLDDDLVILHAAGAIVARRDREAATELLSRADSHYKTLRNRTQAGATKVSLVGSCEPSPVGFRDKIIVGVERG